MTCPNHRSLVVQDPELKISCPNPCPMNRRHGAGDGMPPSLPPDDKKTWIWRWYAPPSPLVVQDPELNMSCPNPYPLTGQHLDLDMPCLYPNPWWQKDLDLEMTCPHPRPWWYRTLNWRCHVPTPTLWPSGPGDAMPPPQPLMEKDLDLEMKCPYHRLLVVQDPYWRFPAPTSVTPLCHEGGQIILDASFRGDEKFWILNILESLGKIKGHV